MPTIIGLDGCSAGWVSASKNLKTSKVELRLIDRLEQINQIYDEPKIIAIDMPVILQNGPRSVDQKARKLLGRRASTIFSAPAKDALIKNDYILASAENFKLTGKKLSVQSFNLFPKIREVQNFLKSHPKINIFESHPELAFMNLNNNQVLSQKKKDKEGFEIRVKLINKIFKNFSFDRYRVLYPKKFVNDDDILDAFVTLHVGLKLYNKSSEMIVDDDLKNMSISF